MLPKCLSKKACTNIKFKFDPKLVYLQNLFTAKFISQIVCFIIFVSTFHYSVKNQIHIADLYKYFNIFLCFLCVYVLIIKFQKVFLSFLFVDIKNSGLKL